YGGLLSSRRHTSVHQTHPHVGQRFSQGGVRIHSRLQLQRLAFLDQRAHPVRLPATLHFPMHQRQHLISARIGNQLGNDGRTTGGQFIDHRHVEVGEERHGQGARNRSRTHVQL